MSKNKDLSFKFITSGLGTGYAPFIPGTFGTFMGIPIIMTVFSYPRWVLAGIILILFPISVYTSDTVEKLYDIKDPSFIVIDEILGFLISMLFLPFQLKYVLFSFIIFRIMDIIKPWPIHQLQNIKGGLGVVIDDVVAGVYAGLFVWLLRMTVHI